jgi:hypothetical protein
MKLGSARKNTGTAQPASGLGISFVHPHKVAPREQPWALLRNPFWILCGNIATLTKKEVSGKVRKKKREQGNRTLTQAMECELGCKE